MHSYPIKIREGIVEELKAGSPVFLWVIRRATICYSRYAVGRDGRTGYERLSGRACIAIVVPMGKEWYKRLRAGERQSKAETEWFGWGG